MIAFLKGRLVERVGELGVIEAGGVGYELRALGRAMHLWETVRDEAHTVFVATAYLEGRRPQLVGFTNVRDKLTWLALLDAGLDSDRALLTIDLLTSQGVFDVVASKDTTPLLRVPGVTPAEASVIVATLGPAPWARPNFDDTTSGLAFRAAGDDDENTLFVTLGRLGYDTGEISEVKSRLDEEGVGLQDPLQDRLRAALNILYGKGE